MVCFNVSGKKLLYRCPVSGHTFDNFNLQIQDEMYTVWIQSIYFVLNMVNTILYGLGQLPQLIVFKIKGPQMTLPQMFPLDISMFKMMRESLRFLFSQRLGVGCNMCLFQVSIPGFPVHVRPCKREIGLNGKKIIWFYQLSWQCKLATVKRFES